MKASVLSRSMVAIVAALVVTAALFFGMRALIAGSEMVLSDYSKRKNIEFVRLRKDSDARTKERQLPTRQRPKPPPSAPDMDMPDSDAPGATAIMAGTPQIDTGLNLGNTLELGPAPGDNDAVPVVRVEPMYPRRAAEQFIEGWVVLEFDVSPNGSTKNVRIVEAKPVRIFDRAAIQAVSKWKYKPKVVDGKPRGKRGLRIRLTFNLD